MEMEANKNLKKCYNQISCILSVMIIAFILGSVIYDVTISKPKMNRAIDDIKQEVQQINQKIDAIPVSYYYDNDTTSVYVGAQ